MDIRSISSKKELLSYIAKGKSAKYLFFWSHNDRKSSEIDRTCFSQWYESSFEVDGIIYETAEHYMMAEKARLFNDHRTADEIISSNNPGKAKALGRQVKGFENSIWEKHRFDVVVRGNIAKFSQHPELQAFLLGTGRRVLVEASPTDKIWGIGLIEDHVDSTNPFRWKGLNLLGFALMMVRNRLDEDRV